MSKIIWLSSYPRSGNTWLRFIISHLVYENVRTSDDVRRLVPDIHHGIKSSDLIKKRNVFIKSHLKYFDGMPLREDTMGAIYIVRNPLDMIASAINYFDIRNSKDLSEDSDEQRRDRRQSIIKEFLEKGGPDRWTSKGFGTWTEHVLSWHRKDLPFPRFTLRYEDLTSQPVESVAQLCRFLNISRSSERIEAALASSSFERLREMEETEVAEGQAGLFATENPTQAFSVGLRFINQGRTEGYRDVLTEDQVEAAQRRFGPIMRQLGYLSNAESGIYTFSNGIKIDRKHLLQIQCDRYQANDNPNLHEPVEEDWFLRLFEDLPGGISTFMDIGAAVGYYCVLVKRRFPNAAIHAIDALERHCRALAETFALNGLSMEGVTVHESALAEKEGIVNFLDHAYGSKIMLANQTGQPHHRMIPVTAHTLESYVAKAGGQVDLAKMDIQGSEAGILESSRTLLRAGQVRSWIVGTHGPDQHRRCLECLSADHTIRFENPKPPFQPDGIIIAVHKSVV
ncbi:MAG: FkbM family methyltransferase [Kiloniellales bacterium]|nr:FkbM family methyltransferase [Kiloniellales bacterium]